MLNLFLNLFKESRTSLEDLFREADWINIKFYTLPYESNKRIIFVESLYKNIDDYKYALRRATYILSKDLDHFDEVSSFNQHIDQYHLHRFFITGKGYALEYDEVVNFITLCKEFLTTYEKKEIEYEITHSIDTQTNLRYIAPLRKDVINMLLFMRNLPDSIGGY